MRFITPILMIVTSQSLLAEPQQAIVETNPLTISVPAGQKLSILNLGTTSNFQPIPVFYVVPNSANPSQEIEFSSWTATTFYGPTKMRIKPIDSGGSPAKIFVSYELTTYTSGFNPMGVAVIPTESTGQFSVKMETSTDLINWSQAIAGNYGSGSPNRFFRVAISKE